MRQRGFILLLTLIMMSIMGLLLLSAFHQLQLLMHALAQRANAHYRFYQLEHVTRKLLTLEHIDNSCMGVSQDANLALQWLYQNKGCKLVSQDMTYFYWVETLGDYPCLVLNNKKKNQATRHYRISVLAASRNSSPAFVQVRVIHPSLSIESCKGSIHYVQQGISSWRYMDVAKNPLTRMDT